MISKAEPKEFWILKPNNRRGEWRVWLIDEVNGQKVNQDSLKVVDKAALEKAEALIESLEDRFKVIRYGLVGHYANREMLTEVDGAYSDLAKYRTGEK